MSDIKQILESSKRVKISVIMQVNLEAYPGSRISSVDKFIRAVESFRNQVYKNAELIIVSDGCNKAYQIYNKNYKGEPNIKFAFYDRTGARKMYEIVETESGPLKYFRGFARGIGLSIATGHLITYMDSDDFLIPEFTLTHMLVYNTAPEKDWWLNTSWYDHENIVNATENVNFLVDPKTQPTLELDAFPGHRFRESTTKDGRLAFSPWLFCHKNYKSVPWRDVLSGGVSEDVDFFNRFQKAYPNGEEYKKPIYIRCHWAGQWDI